jgi:hypothetical protein
MEHLIYLVSLLAAVAKATKGLELSLLFALCREAESSNHSDRINPQGFQNKGVSTGWGLLSVLWNGVVEEELIVVDGYTMGYLDSVYES